MKKSISPFLVQQWDALLAAATACIAIYYLTRFGGIGISPDSVGYSIAAINLKEKGALIDFNGLALVDFPLGYPIFLATNYLITGIQPILIAPFINAILYSGLIIMSGCLMHEFRGITKWYRFAVLVLLAASTCLWEVYSMVWSETLFLFLIILFMLAWKNYTQKKTYASLFVIAVIAALAFVTRFAGITVVATGAALILFDGSLQWIKKIKQLLVFLLIGFSMVIANIIRNRIVSGTVSGVREKALRTVADNLLDIGAVMGSWFPFIGVHKLAGAILFCVLVALAAIQIIYRLIQQQFYLKNETMVHGFFLVYSVFIVTVSSISRFEELSSRLLSPIYIPMIWVSTSWIPAFINQQTKLWRSVFLLAATILFLAFFNNQYKQNVANWEGIASAGIPGYSELQWKESPMAKYINANKDSLQGAIYSDAYDGLYYLTGVKSFPLPHKEIEKEKEAFLQHPSIIVVWFNDGVNKDLIELDYIQSKKQLLKTKTFEDGAIYYYGDLKQANK